MGLVSYRLPEDYSPDNDMISDEIMPKFSGYKGVLVGDSGMYQNYPAVKQAGVFDSFIGDNSDSLTHDSGVNVVPNISYCSFSQSPAPWDIHSNCLKLDASVNQAQHPYVISITKPDSVTIDKQTLNNISITTADNNMTGTVTIVAHDSSSGHKATLKIGFSKLGDIPSEQNNTMLSEGFSGRPMAQWDSANQKLLISLTPIA
ncbi:hypothetical protein [Dongshaea marina]|uniref:hypothetical protein n=1 Tax=Dongshaea marina TaxID=2047966 RepID=UPI000D3EAEFF|nr:hypothetical protein [Dongshaea marina]